MSTSASPINVSSILQSFGLGGSTNVDVNTIVSQLMLVNSQPLTTLQNDVSGYQLKISAFGSLLSSVGSLNTAVSALQNTTVALSATSSQPSYFTATANSGATAGSTSINVSNIASAQSLYSTAFGSQSGPVADLSESGTQYLKIQAGSNTSEITINSSNNSLAGIATAINNQKIGVTASVIQQAPDFVIGATNNQINFDYGGSNYTATIAKSDYSGSGLATAITNAMNTAVTAFDNTNPFSVSYSAGGVFSIKNGSAVNSATINWADNSTTLTPQQLGFMPDKTTDTYGNFNPPAAPNTESSALNAGTTITGTAVNGMYALSLTSDSTGATSGITVKVDESINDFKTAAGYIGEVGSNIDKFGLSALASHATFDPVSNAVTSGLSNLTQSSAGVDAQLTVAGVPVTSSSNNVTTAVPGVTLNLLASGKGTVTVASDSTSLASKLSSFVTAYNSAMGTINLLYEPGTDANGAQQQSVLGGDAQLLTLQQFLGAVPSTAYGSSGNPMNNYLSSIGISTDKNGVMSFNSSTLSSAYSSGSQAASISSMVNNFAHQLGSILSNAVNSGIPAESNDLQNQVKTAQNRETELQAQLNIEQALLTAQYTQLSSVVASYANISKFLTTQTNLITKSNSGG
ncbi:MAG: flagellar filament capping protein FliD [Nitrospirae bacterium]|nr:flagellar filament capping protein FliD [Nitrospirota bacterium]